MAFKGFEWRNFSQAVVKVNFYLLAGGMALYMSSYLLRGIRWRMMLYSVKPLSVWEMTKFVIIGFMCNNLLPARLGEFARALVISQKEKISARASFASIVMERVFDGATIAAMLITLLFIQPFPDWVKKLSVFASALFLGSLILLIIIGYKGEKWIGKIQSGASIKIIGKAAGFMMKFVWGLQILKSKQLIFWVFILSGIIWAIEAVNYLIIMRSMGWGLSIGAAAFVLVVANLGIMIPSSPGNVGTMQYFCILALSLYGILKDQALAYSLILHAEMYIPVTILGILFLTSMGMSLKNIRISRNRALEE